MAESFKEYLRCRRVTDDPVGEFVTDARADRSLPDARSWGELEFYLTMKGAIPGAVAAARTIWCGFLDVQRRPVV